MALRRRVADHQNVFSRRALLSLLFAAVPAFAGHAEAKRAAKQARKRAKETKSVARQDVSERKASAKQRDQERYRLNQSNAELDKGRRQDHADLNTRRKAHITRTVIDSPKAEEPKPGIDPVTRNVDPAPEPKNK
jgi:hypothetical protein